MMKTSRALELLFPNAGYEEQKTLSHYLLGASKVIEVARETLLFSYGENCDNYFFLLEGQVKVYAAARNGREIMLYRIKPGETCVLSTNCMAASQYYPASAKTETDCRALSVPTVSLQEAMKHSPLINLMLMDNFASRIGCLVELVSEVALERLDVRLARHLLQLCAQNQEIHTTHENLAREIGTAREVISRHLGQFESKGWIYTTRGLIHIRQHPALQALSEGFFVKSITQ